MRRRSSGRPLRGESLEPRIALHGEPLLASEPRDLLRPFPTGLGHADPAVRAAIEGITTTGPADQFSFLDDSTRRAFGPAADQVGASSIESGQLIGLPSFRADERFAGIDGSGYSVVIIDSGIDLDHPFFGPDANGDQIADRIVYNADFVTGGPNADDVLGHGTHVSSIIASEDATYSGVAPGSDIIHLRVLDDNGFGTAQGIESALQWVVANAQSYNVASVNMSLGFGDNHSSPTTRPDLGLSDELAALTALGVITVSASGNEFMSYGSAPGVGYPSADPNSLSVGAVWDADEGGPIAWSSGAQDNSTGADRVASFSQRHPELTTVFAPGAFVTAAGIGGGLATYGGTSMAAPQVAGMAAVMQQLAVQTTGERLSASEFGNLLKLTGESILDGDDEDDNVDNTEVEYRRVDMVAMANALVSGGLSDLAVAGEIAARSSSAPAGGRLRLDFAIGNQGPAGTSAFTSKIYLSTDEVIDSSDILLATVNDELAGGQSSRRTGHVVDLPSGLLAGNYFVGILLDDQSAIVEADEQNNVAAIPISVTDPAPAMWLQDLSSESESLGNGATIQFGQALSGGADLAKTFRIYNDGSTQLVLSGLSVPAGYSVTNFPETVAPLETAEFEAALLATGGDGQYAGEISFSTNDADVNPFAFMVTGIVDHGATPATVGSISVNAPVSASIATAGDADWFAFEAVSGVEYRIETSLGTLLDSVLRIRDGAGVELAMNDDSEGGLHSTLVWTAPDDGEFYVEVRGKASRTGTYQLSLAAGDTHGNDAASATLTSDPSVNPGAIEAPGDVDWFAFTAAAGIDYRFEALADTLPAASLQLYGADGTTLLAPADGGGVGALIDWRAPASGTYYLAVAGGTGSMIGSYRLAITGEDDHGDNAANATLVSAPAAPGEIEEREDVDWFAFNAIKGSAYQLSTAVQGRSDTLLRLIARDGVTELDRDEAGPQDSGSFLQWTAPATGRYYLEISGVGERFGKYSLTTSVLDDHGNDATTATLTTDPSDNVGIIESPTDADWFAFEVIAGASYRLEFTGGALADPLLGAIDVDGQTVLVTSAPGSSAIEWIAPQNGVAYFLVTSASGGRLGDYALRLTGADEHGDNAQNATSLVVPSNMPGALQGAADRDWFSFTSVDGLDYRFEATPEAPAVIRLYESDGTTLIAEASGASGVPAVIDWTSTATDVYFLELVAELAAPAVDAPPADVPYSLRSSVVGRVPGDYEGDSNVDGHDFLLWQQTVGSTTDLRADGNVDGVVDGADLSFWDVRYGQTFSGPVGALSGSMSAAEAHALPDAGEPFGESGQSQALPWITGLDRARDEARPSLGSVLRRVRAESVGGARDRAMATWRLNDRGPEPIRNATALERIMTITERLPWNEDAESEEDEWDEAILEAFGLRGE